MIISFFFFKLFCLDLFKMNLSHPEDEPPLLVQNVNLKKTNAMNLEDDLHKMNLLKLQITKCEVYIFHLNESYNLM